MKVTQVKSSATRRTVSKPMTVKIPGKNVRDFEKYFTDAGLPAQLGRDALREILVGISALDATGVPEEYLCFPSREEARNVATKLIACHGRAGYALHFFDNGKWKYEDFMQDGAMGEGLLDAWAIQFTARRDAERAKQLAGAAVIA